jgi:hypothetical protein
MEPDNDEKITQLPDPALDPSSDIPLFRSLRFSSRTFSPVKSGRDLLAHRDPDGAVCYYLWHWSEKSGEKNTCAPVTEDFAVRYIRELSSMQEAMAGLEPMNLMEYLPVLYSRDRKKTGKERP